jgi:hypothetical protein
MKAADAVMLFPYVWYDPTDMSLIHASGFGTIGVAFLYFDALNLHAMVEILRPAGTFTYNTDLKKIKENCVQHILHHVFPGYLVKIYKGVILTISKHS